MTSKEGFIRHRGGKCPVEAGTLVDVRYRSGDINLGVPALTITSDESHVFGSRRGGYLDLASYWGHDGLPGDIMAYRIHTPSEQPATAEEPAPVEPVAPAECTNEDSWNCKYCRKTETCEALKDPRNFGEPQVKPIAGPLQWRDRITEIDAESKAENERHKAAMAALNSERAELVQKLASEGLAMIERKAEPVEDMSDWRNWKAGDLITHVAGDWTDYTKGKQYPVKEVGAEFIKTRDDVEDRFMEVDGAYMFEDGRFPSFEWHSRPTN